MARTSTRSTILAVLVMALLLLSVLPADAQPVRQRVDAFAGQPVESALEVSKAYVPDDASTAVVLGRSDDFADNLGGSALARTIGRSALFLTDPDQLDPRVRDEIVRALPTQPADCTDLESRGEAQIYILGGPNAIAQGIEDELRQSFCVKRLAGASRFETSIEVAAQVETILMNSGRFTEFQYLISRADNAVDSATGGAYGGQFGVPILVTPTDFLHPAVEQYLAAGSSRVTLLGGTAALSQAVEDQIRQATPSAAVDRFAGTSRDDTARLIAEEFAVRNNGIGAALLVNGFQADTWVFAFTATAVTNSAPILYVQTDDLLSTTRSFLQGQAPIPGVGAFGDTNLISDQTLDAAVAAGS